MKYYPKKKTVNVCPNNDAIVCLDHSKCSRCGWDPKVEEERRQSVLEEREEKRRPMNA